MKPAASCLPAQRRRGIKGFRGLARHPPRQSEIGTMAGVAAFGAVAVGSSHLPEVAVMDPRRRSPTTARRSRFLCFQLGQSRSLWLLLA
jgi:hypothetical protein